MKITFLGTSASNAFPEAFCGCENCQQARILGGKSLRKRSAILVNDDLLIDLNPDIMTASQIHKCSLLNVRYCLQTHPHADHLDINHLNSRSPGFGTIGAPVLNFYASAETLQRTADTFERDLADYPLMSPEAEERLNLKIHQVEPLLPFAVGDYRVVAFPANHAPTMGALIFSIESNNRTIFYGTDTGPLFEETWQAFHKLGLQFDLVILDHTFGRGKVGMWHMTTADFIEHLRRMRTEGYLKPNARVFATHIAHDANPPHPEMEGIASQHGYEVAYDGLILEI